MMISVIIPTHNSEKTIEDLILSVINEADFISRKNYYEIIIVDDCSKDKTVDIARKYAEVQLHVFKNQQGPSAARNRGAKIAKGDILLFLDSDTTVVPGCLSEVRQTFVNNKQIHCVNGICSSKSLNPGIFPQYKAFIEHSWSMSIPNLSNNHSCFNSRIGAICKSIFDEVGGFDTIYRTAQVEDYEFGYRLTKKHKIYCNVNIQVNHNYPDLKTITRNYIDRTSAWFKLFHKRKQFDTGGTSLESALGYASGFFIVASGFLLFSSKPLSLLAFWVLASFLFIYCNRFFLKLLLRQKKASVLFLNVLIQLYFSFVVIFGAFLALFRLFFVTLSKKNNKIISEE